MSATKSSSSVKSSSKFNSSTSSTNVSTSSSKSSSSSTTSSSTNEISWIVWTHGINLPTITFSFKPWSVSVFPLIEASVNTLVVSWNEAADKNDGVSRDALVIPKIIGLATAGLPCLNKISLLAAVKSDVSTLNLERIHYLLDLRLQLYVTSS